jgi:mono/diheme cytochrome c family protein
MLKKALARLLVLGVACAILAAILIAIVAPRMDWSATATPGTVENRIAGLMLDRWIRLNAADQKNPLAANEENLKIGQREFGEHCAVCHGPNGGAHDKLRAEFYPPIARLDDGAADWSDGELYFIVTRGIRYTGMPGFGPRHKPERIWQIILWVRHLPKLTAAEKAPG